MTRGTSQTLTQVPEPRTVVLPLRRARLRQRVILGGLHRQMFVMRRGVRNTGWYREGRGTGEHVLDLSYYWVRSAAGPGAHAGDAI